MSAVRRVSRAQCANCTCSPGLLSRTNKRSSWVAKQINLRNSSGSTTPRGSRKGSVFTVDAASLCVPDTKEVNTSKRLESLRRKMAENDLGVYIIPSSDEHQSEYVAAKDQRRSFISGFSGSAGVAIITRDVMCMNDTPEGLAALSTDGRYFIQAANELDFNWVLLRSGVKDQPTWQEWAVDQALRLNKDSGKTIKIGVDPKLISVSYYEKINSVIKTKSDAGSEQVELVGVEENLIDSIWSDFEEVPAVPKSKIRVLDIKYAGKPIFEKINSVSAKMKSNKAQGLVISALDEIAWLLNLRGSDIEFNPVFYSYFILTETDIILFADKDRFEDKVEETLSCSRVKIEPYEKFWDKLKEISANFKEKNKKLLLPSSISWEILRSINCSYESIEVSPVEDLKAIKNETELEGAKSAHLKDGKALIKFFAWLENELLNKGNLIDEVEADERLTAFRKEEENFVGLSFDTISATGANGAIIHYKPVKGSCSVINPHKIYLNDSGSQFLEGTTDTTRTVHFGEPTKVEKRNYTLVLKGNLALEASKFPENTPGSAVDSIARQFLWKYCLDYGHGTSHGVGSYLNVHEGPIGVNPRCTSVLKSGHLISNEPGYYEDGEYGIRIENVMFVKDTGMKYAGKNFYEFETVTKVPYCRKLIDKSLLSSEEVAAINRYHQIIWKSVSPLLAKDSLEYSWLKRETAYL